MRVVCWQTILMNIIPIFVRKLRNKSQNFSSAAVMLSALRVNVLHAGYMFCNVASCFVVLCN